MDPSVLMAEPRTSPRVETRTTRGSARNAGRRILITGGTVVNAGGSAVADVLVDGETVAAVGRDLVSSAGGGSVRCTPVVHFSHQYGECSAWA